MLRALSGTWPYEPNLRSDMMVNARKIYKKISVYLFKKFAYVSEKWCMC